LCLYGGRENAFLKHCCHNMVLFVWIEFVPMERCWLHLAENDLEVCPTYLSPQMANSVVYAKELAG